MKSEWKRCALGQICTMKYGKMPDKHDLVEAGYPIFTGYLIAGYHRRFIVEDSEIIIVARGVGGAGDVKLSPPFCWITNISIILQIVDNDIDKMFLYYRLKCTTLRSLRTGAAQPQIIIADLEKYIIDVPPLPTQRRIAAILSAYDDLIENNTRRIKILEEMAQALYREWFVHFRFPGHEKVQMVDSPLGRIPEGWQIEKLGNIADINAVSLKNGYSPEEIHYVDISSVSTGQIDKIEHIPLSEAPSRARRIVRHGDVIWSTVRPNRRSYSLIINSPPNLVVSTGFAVISSRHAPYTYIYQALTTDDFVSYLTNHATGAAYPAVNAHDFEEADILLPHKDLMDLFHLITEDFMALKCDLVEKNANLRFARDLLLPKLINDRIIVNEIFLSEEKN